MNVILIRLVSTTASDSTDMFKQEGQYQNRQNWYISLKSEWYKTCDWFFGWLSM